MRIQRNFFDITKKFFGGGYFTGSRVSIEDSHNPDYRATHINIRPRHGENYSLEIWLDAINKSVPENLINIWRSGYLNEALKLAEAYEKAGFGEFTVKKQYEE